jgi:hypothetical protein
MSLAGLQLAIGDNGASFIRKNKWIIGSGGAGRQSDDSSGKSSSVPTRDVALRPPAGFVSLCAALSSQRAQRAQHRFKASGRSYARLNDELTDSHERQAVSRHALTARCLLAVTNSHAVHPAGQAGWMANLERMVWHLHEDHECVMNERTQALKNPRRCANLDG